MTAPVIFTKRPAPYWLRVLRAIYLDWRIRLAEEDIEGYRRYDNPPEGTIRRHRHAIEAWRVERMLLGV